LNGREQPLKFLPWIKTSVFIACLIPFGRLLFQAYTGNLGVNPVETITRSTGIWTLTFLLITLSVTPLRKMTGWHNLIKLRRMLGLFAFFYVSLHFATFIVFDHFFDLQGIVKDVAKRPFITVGFTSFLLLIPLALTSTSGMVRRLGKRWQQLHRLVYVAAIGGVIHFFWLVKADLRRPLIYGSVLTLLLAYRLAVKWQPKLKRRWDFLVSGRRLESSGRSRSSL
jgi:sulfoxide reductase heme-binding subunit YedZ